MPHYPMGQADSTAFTEDVVASQAAGAISSPDSVTAAVGSPLKTLLNLAHVLELAASPLDASRLCLKFVLQLSGMDYGIVYLIDPKSQSLCPAAFEGVSDAFTVFAAKIDLKSPQWNLLIAGKSTRIEVSVLLAPSSSVLAAECLDSVIVTPVLYRGNILACFALGPQRLNAAPYNGDLLEMATALVGGALARLHAEIQSQDARSELDRQIQDLHEALQESKKALAAESADRKTAEASVRNHSSRRQIMKDIAMDIMAAKPPQAIAESALDRIQRRICCSHASVVEFDHGKDEAVFLAIHSSVPSKLSRNFALDKGAFPLNLLGNGQVCGSGNPGSVAEPSVFDRLLIQEGVQSHIMVPLRYKNELIGMLNLGVQEPAFFNADHVEAASEAGLALSLAMRHTRMHRQALKDAETKAILLHEMNHRVKNNLSAILGLLFGAKRGAKLIQDVRHVALIDNLIGRIQGLATTHRLLSAGQWAPLSLENLSQQVVLSCLHALAPGKNVVLDIGHSDILVTAKSANSLALILSELATNTIRHAIGERATARITVRSNMVSGLAMIEFQDDGPGYPETMLHGQGLNAGLCLVQAIARNDLRGTIAFQNDGGALARLRFKPDDPNSKL